MSRCCDDNTDAQLCLIFRYTTNMTAMAVLCRALEQLSLRRAVLFRQPMFCSRGLCPGTWEEHPASMVAFNMYNVQRRRSAF